VKNHHTSLLLLALCAFLILIINTCTEKYPASNEKLALDRADGCLSCHLDAELLKKVADPLPEREGDAGEG